MNINTTSSKDIESRLSIIADKYSTNSRGRSPFKGHNFMTPNIVARRKMNNGVWFELSYDRFVQEWLLGVTLIGRGGDNCNNIQGSCDTFSEVREKLERAKNI